MAVASYTFAKATDDAAAFTTADLNGAVIAQNWLDLDAERAPSSVRSASSADGPGRVCRQRVSSATGVFTSQLTVGSGLPLTPLYLTSLAGTGLTGTLRAELHRRSRR